MGVSGGVHRWRYSSHQPHAITTMASSALPIKIGCTTTIAATYFDGDEDPPWSQEVFGADAAEKVLEATVIASVRGRWRVHVPFDNTSYVLSNGELTHAPATCRKCWPVEGQDYQDAPSGAAAPSVAGVRALGDGGAGVQSADLPVPGLPNLGPESADEDSEDERPLDLLARAAVNRRSPSPTRSDRGVTNPLRDPVQRPRKSKRSIASRDEVAELEISSASSLGQASDNTGSDEDWVSENVYSTTAGRGRGRGNGDGGRRTGREGDGGRGRRRRRTPDPAQHGEGPTHITRHGQRWNKGQGRTTDPYQTGSGFRDQPRFTLYGYTLADEMVFFQHLFPPCLVVGIVNATIETAKVKLNNRQGWSIEVGELWCFLGLKTYMMIFPMAGPVEHFWEAPVDMNTIYVEHNLGRFGMTVNRFREIERCFTLPHHGRMDDIFNPVRKFVDMWNANMVEAFIPGWVIVVDESMAKWLGKGMPGLMVVPRKPTPKGREAHTTACGVTGVIIFYEIYEGKEKMNGKEFVKEAGKNPAKALRCTKAWFRSGRVIVVDSGFASVTLAAHLFDNGLYMIGNVKTADRSFPKEWLLSQVPRRGMRAMCTTTVTTPCGNTMHLLATADMDKQPMALVGSAGTSAEGRTLHRKFTTIKADGTFFLREASLDQDHLHELYRAHFNALDKHNSVRQGGHCFEDSWRTTNWATREFQAVWGVTEVNAWLLYKRLKPGEESLSFDIFRRRLCYKMLMHPTWVEERRRMRSAGLSTTVPGDPHPYLCMTRKESGMPNQKTCAYCSAKTSWYCACTASEDFIGVFCCNPNTGRQCFALHRAGVKTPNRKSDAQKRRWERAREHTRSGRGRGRARRGGRI